MIENIYSSPYYDIDMASPKIPYSNESNGRWRSLASNLGAVSKYLPPWAVGIVVVALIVERIVLHGVVEVASLCRV